MFKKTFVTLLIISMLFLAGCKKEDGNKKDYLSEDYIYDASISALVYEPIEDEEDYGIVYREVTDFDKMKATESDVLLYFYSSLSTDYYGITAGIEDIAQISSGSLMVVAIDGVMESDLSTKYGIEASPEFVLIRQGEEVDRFNSNQKDSWTMTDVAQWVQSQGYHLDYSKIN